MSPYEHYQEAERLLSEVKNSPINEQSDPIVLAMAQVHATLASVSPTMYFQEDLT